MDITITGRNVGITDRFRSYATEKADKVDQLADRAQALEVRLCRHHETNGTAGDDRVELTMIGPGPVVRAEAAGQDKYAAFDIALGKLIERIRRAKDRRKVHRGQHRPDSVRAADHHDFHLVDVMPVDIEVLDRVNPSTGGYEAPAEVADSGDGDQVADYTPVVIRQKVFASVPMTIDDALYYMELVGHDFYLFIDRDSGRPSVVYRRKGWDYGVIGLDDSAEELQEVATATRALQRQT